MAAVSTMMSRNEDFRAIVALNNMGVSLIEHRAYRQAMSAFKDALTSMSTLYRPTALNFLSSCEHQQENNCIGDARNRLHAKRERARERLAAVATNNCSDWHTGTKTICYENAMLDRSRVESVISSLQSSPKYICIRIEPTESCCLLDRREVEFQAALMLYNYGMVHLCLARLADSKQDASKASMWRQGAIRILTRNLSLSKYVLREEDIRAATVVVHDDFEERVVLMSLLSVATLLQTICESGCFLSSETAKFTEKAKNLRGMLTARLQVKPLRTIAQCHAAAA